MSEPPSVLSRVVSVPDFLLRMLYFWAAPFAVIVLAKQFPLRAALLNVALALSFFFAAEWLASRVPAGSPLGRFVQRQLALERHYREHPPRPFVYYVFFPLLFPYWLLSRPARREAVLFRRFAANSLVLLAALRALDFWRHWYPVVPFREFVGRALGVLLIQLIVTFVLAMPLVITVVGFHLERKRKRLVALAAVGALAVLAGVVAARTMRFAVPLEVAARMELKTQHRPEAARAALEAALRAARAAAPPPRARRSRSSSRAPRWTSRAASSCVSTSRTRPSASTSWR